MKKFIEKMRATSSSLEKVEIIKNSNEFIHKVLEATYNPYKQYYVTSKTCIKNAHLVKKHKLSLFEVLDMLSNRKVTGHKAIALVNGFGGGCGDVIYKIIDKDLEIRAGDKVINKAVPGLIPTFKVTLAKEFEGKCDWDDKWHASRKLDGVRCLARVDVEGVCTLYSRTGKEFTTLNKVKEAIEATGIINMTFDGEICLVDDQGNEDFQGVMKQLRRKDHQIENPAYMVFDMITNKVFDDTKGETLLSYRLHTLRSWLNGRNVNKDILRYTEQFVILGDEHLENWVQMAADNNWEGVVLRKDVGYEGKRTKNLVKVKKFFDAEYEVLDADYDKHEVVRDGRSETIEMLAQVWIEHKGHQVKVGSGFTQEQRIRYTTETITGKIICVRYFEETKNDKGGISLRFPTLKYIYDGERDM
tara:strand:+ start:487 stop:1734 length:1248 start_codon:yes stop_codon:yes gene_type:complete